MTKDICRNWTITDKTGSVTKSLGKLPLSKARERALEWLRQGDYNVEPESGTMWVDGYLRCLSTDENIKVIVAIDPVEPKCCNEEHNWINERVRANGGGVIISSSCSSCHIEKIQNTWAQRRDTGEQGLTSVRYRSE